MAPATTEIYTLSLHDALPISIDEPTDRARNGSFSVTRRRAPKDQRPSGQKSNKSSTNGQVTIDRKSTRLNSSHLGISYAVFCLKKKKIKRKAKIDQPTQA